MRSLPAGGDMRSIEAREALVVEAVRLGAALPIVWCPIHSDIPGHTATFYVASDTLRFGEPGPNQDPTDWNWIRIAVTANTAQQIADVLGVLLPTDRIADLAHAQATVRLTPHWQSPVTGTADAMLRHHAEIEAERAGRDGLLSTIGKDWILGRELFPLRDGGAPAHPLRWDGAINYGWHTVGPPTPSGPYVGQPGVILWQTKGLRHNRRHVDYSQWIPRLVHPQMEVDGSWALTAEVMRSPDLARLLNYDGPLPDVRYPNPPGRRSNQAVDRPPDGGLRGARPRGSWSPAAEGAGETGSPATGGAGAALTQLARQLDMRFPRRSRGPLDGLGADEVLRITEDARSEGAPRYSPDLAALTVASQIDDRVLRAECVYDAQDTRYLAIVARRASACREDPSAWNLATLDASPGDSSSDAGSVQGDQAADGAKRGAAIGGTVGTALEAVPAIGPVLHGLATAIGAIGGAIAGATKDTFHPSPTQAAAWLALFHIAPALVFSGVDTITTNTGDSAHPAEEHAARLVRYFLLVSGLVRNSAELYNPNDIRNDNPYMARVDRRYPLTNPAHLRVIKAHMLARRPVRSEIRTRAQARFILALLRRTLAASGIIGWSEAQANLLQLRAAVRGVRRLAGERRPDRELAGLLGGAV